MTKTPHEISDGEDQGLIPPEYVWIHGWDGDNLNEAHWSVCGVDETDVRYIRADIAEQAAAKEREEILEMIEGWIRKPEALECKIHADWRNVCLEYVRKKIQQRGKVEGK